MFKDLVYLLIAHGAKNADPVGPNACPSSINPWEWDEEKGWWGVTWVNGDATCYTQFSEDGGSSVSDSVSPGITQYTPNWTFAEIISGDLYLRHIKNGIVDDCDWQVISYL
jgi:hypothetical protein